MPKQSYGDIPKGRSRSLLFALLDFANDALEADEAEIDCLRGHIAIHWQSATRLVVRTKLRYLQALTRLTTTPLTASQIKTALKHWADFLTILEDNRTAIRGSDNWHFTLSLWGDRWDREGNGRQFEQAWTRQKNIALPPPSSAIQQGDRHDWHTICRETLRLSLTSNPLTAGDGMAFELGELYVPLGVIAVGEEEESSSYEPMRLLAHHQPFNSPQRIAIIGEPGAGKTTFLQQLALGLNATNHLLPVWIPLADVGGRSLENYLLEVWLKQAFKQFTIDPKIIAEFVALIQAQRVCLLLDAIDEMGDNLSQLTTKIDRELQGWLGQTSVILTCRHAVWNTGKNALNYFQTYRCQQFSHDPNLNQVQQFIQQWFRGQTDLGDRLQQALNRTVHRRIREVVRHPLYLALLCRTWQLTQGKLPATKAILYRQFVEALYDWKQDSLPTSRNQRQILNQTLAQFARWGMQQTPPKFRFRQGEIQAFFEVQNSDLFTLALQLGWLNLVGHSEKTGEKVYGFYHPTFQEYFAATAIAHWQFFMDASNQHPIFQTSWQETILLWLGREDIAETDKETFLQTLAHWRDHCGGFYEQQAICFIGRALAEFPEFSQAQQVIEQLIQWRFVRQHPALPAPLIEQAGSALSSSDRHRTIPALETLLHHHQNSFDRWLVAHSLGKNHDLGNPTAIATLEGLLNETTDPIFQLNLCRSLGSIDPHNQHVLATLTYLLKSDQKVRIRRKAALRLGKIQPHHPLAIQTLTDLLNQTQNAHLYSTILDTLREIYPDHPLLDNHTPAQLLPLTSGRVTKQKSPQELQLATQTILKKLELETNPDQRTRLVARLAAYDPHQPIILTELLNTLVHNRKKASLKLAVETIHHQIEDAQLPILLPQIKAIYLHPKCLAPNKRACYKLLWYWSQQLPYMTFYQLWHLEN